MVMDWTLLTVMLPVVLIGLSDESPTKISGVDPDESDPVYVNNSLMLLTFTSDNTTTGSGFHACVCSVWSSCECPWLVDRRSRDWSAEEDGDLSDGSRLSTNAILGICLCVGIPLLMVAIFCLYSKCSKSGAVYPERPISGSSSECPKPVFVLYTHPPPYDVSPPSYDEAIEAPTERTDTEYPVTSDIRRLPPIVDQRVGRPDPEAGVASGSECVLVTSVSRVSSCPEYNVRDNSLPLSTSDPPQYSYPTNAWSPLTSHPASQEVIQLTTRVSARTRDDADLTPICF